MTNEKNEPAGDPAAPAWDDETMGIAPDVAAAIRRATQAHNIALRGAKKHERRAAEETRHHRHQRLLAAGYPRRAVIGIDEMTGKAQCKADELQEIIGAPGGAMLAILGTWGTGKTTIATALASRLKHPGRYTTAWDLYQRIKASWDRPETEADVLRPYLRTSFLVIDEVHRRPKGEWSQGMLENLVVHRCGDMSTTIFVGNVQPERLGAELGGCIVDRIREMGGIAHCDWASYRGAGK